MTSGYMYVLPDGMTIRLCMADAAGPDSKIHLNTTATWIDWGRGWRRLNCHLHIARRTVENVILMENGFSDLLDDLKDYL